MNGCFACKHLFSFDTFNTFEVYCNCPDAPSLTEDGDIIICNNFEPKEENKHESSKSTDTE